MKTCFEYLICMFVFQTINLPSMNWLLKSYTWSSTSENQYNQNQDNRGLKRRIKRNNFLIKIPNAHLILRLHLLHLLNCFWWWWWCWWVQLILFFIFSPPLQVDGCHLYAHLTPHHNLILVTHIHTTLFICIELI